MDSATNDTIPGSLTAPLTDYPVLTLGAYSSGYLFDPTQGSSGRDVDVYRYFLEQGKSVTITALSYYDGDPNPEMGSAEFNTFLMLLDGAQTGNTLVRNSFKSERSEWFGNRGEVSLSLTAVFNDVDIVIALSPIAGHDIRGRGPYDLIVTQLGDPLPIPPDPPETEPDCEIGGPGNDRFKATAEADCFKGRAGVDRVTYFASDEGVIVSLADSIWQLGYAEGDRFKSIENITGSRKADYVVGDGVGNVLEGLGGQDTLYGGGGADRLKGGNGEDQLFGDGGRDRLIGGRHDDELWGGNGRDTLLGGSGSDVLRGQFGKDVLKGEGGDDRLFLSRGGDTLDGGADFDVVLYGPLAAGFDTRQNEFGAWVALKDGEAWGEIINVEKLVGSTGDDVFEGRQGGIIIDGKDGDDTILTGAGRNEAFGGKGEDTFVLGAAEKDVVRGQGNQDTFVFVTPEVLSSDYQVQASVGSPTVVIRDLSLASNSSTWFGDRLAFEGYSEFSDVEMLVSRAFQQGRHTILQMDDLTIKLINVNVGDLNNAIVQHDDFAILI